VALELRKHRVHHPAAPADVGGGDAAWPRWQAAPYRKRHTTPAGVLLDLRAESSAASLDLLLAAASSTLQEMVASPFDCAMTLPRRRGTQQAVGSNASALGLAWEEQEYGDGPVSRALAGRVAIIANGYLPHPDWPDYWRVLENAGYRSLLSVPVPLGSGRFAALTLLSARDNVFTAAVAAAATAFGKRAGNSYAVAEEFRAARSSAAQLTSALESRPIIDAACGVIMVQNKCSYEAAFEILAKASSHRNIKVRRVAEGILRNVSGTHKRS
jgi:GAF domain-containing protein